MDLEDIKQWRKEFYSCKEALFLTGTGIHRFVEEERVFKNIDWLIEQVEFLEHDLSELRKNCFVYADVEKVFHKVMHKLWEEKEITNEEK